MNDEERHHIENEAQHVAAQGSNHSVPGEDSPEVPRPFVNIGPRESVDILLERWGLSVSFNGTWIQRDVPHQADRPSLVESYLSAEQLADRDVLDELTLYVRQTGVKVDTSVIKAAFRKSVRQQKRAKQKEILREILKPDPFVAAAAESEWKSWSRLFDMPASISIASAQHTIWQVKRKAANLPVSNHLMMVIFGAEQGSGKTTLVRRVSTPLGELASGDVLLSDFAYNRSGDIYRYPLVIIDDLEQIASESVPVLKSLISATTINRRQLQTSNSVSLRQAATLIGTANRPVSELIDDDTGHRRFVMMPFRNGNEARGGNSEIWRIVNSIDTKLLWDSVDHYEKSPLTVVLKDLHAYQSSYKPAPKLLKWLRVLDLKSEKVSAISVQGGVRSDMLRDLYIQETGDLISRQKFADQMAIYVGDESVPFSEKFKKEVGAIYRPRPGRKGPLTDPSTAPPTPPEPTPPAGSVASIASVANELEEVESER